MSRIDSFKEKISSVKLPFKKTPSGPVNQGPNPIWIGGSDPSLFGADIMGYRSQSPTSTTSPHSPSVFSDSPNNSSFGNNLSTYHHYSSPPQSSSSSVHSQYMSSADTTTTSPPFAVSGGTNRPHPQKVTPDYPVTPYPTPNAPSPSAGLSEVHSPEAKYLRLVSQLQQEKVSHSNAKSQLDRYPEEKAQLLKENNTLKSQIETLEKENFILTQTLEDYSQKKEKTVTELNKIQSSQDPDKIHLQTQLDKQKNIQLSLTIENCQLKARIDNTQKLSNNLSNELTSLRSGIEKEKATINQLEKDNSQYKENWGKTEETLENEKTAKFALLREIQELKKNIKSITDLTSKVEFLERKTKEEQSKRSELDTRYIELEKQFNDISQKGIAIENFGSSLTNNQSDIPTQSLTTQEVDQTQYTHQPEIPTENFT